MIPRLSLEITFWEYVMHFIFILDLAISRLSRSEARIPLIVKLSTDVRVLATLK